MKTLKQLPRWTWQAAVAVAVLLTGFWWLMPTGETSFDEGITFEAQRGSLEITVVEGGEAQSTQAQEIRSEVQGRTAIIDIVEEGYRVTEEDIEDGLVLVELDSSDLEEQLTQQEIDYQNALASLTEAEEQYQITLSQNESNIHDAELALKFSQMDLERFLGDDLGREILAQVETEVEREYFAAATDTADVMPEGVDAPQVDVDIDVFDGDEPELETAFDYQALIDDDRLGGEARQELRDLDSEITLTEEELTQAETQYQWTVELAEEGFVTSDEEERDRLSVQRNEISRDAALTERDLFVGYEFPKQLEDLVSEYVQARRQLEREQRQAAAEAAQAEARLRSQRATYELQAQRKQELIEQIEASEIRAKREGLVVYATGGRGDDPIEEGTEVRERQEILTIPDMNHMAVEVQVHESMVNRLQTGQSARITTDSHPEETLRGEVTRVALVPDSGHRWLNPDLRVFPTTVEIDGAYEWLRPGMTAEVEIIVSSLDEVVYVPLQSVVSLGRDRYVYVLSGSNAEARRVETGEYNDSYIHIESGLEEGERVLLQPPRPDGAGHGLDEDEQEREPMDGPGMPGGAGGAPSV